ncbi:peptide chain release factor N(5)-glutamine methyltransferase [bacterium]|nr:peptide chain release factor N(5)-glutamine methyltransferase [candidate division CSSED10-310 bacterium]
MSERWTARRLIAWTDAFFAGKGIETHRLDAELLLAMALNCSRVQLYLDLDRPVTGSELDGFRGLVKRRADREPVALIRGEREFYSRSFKIVPGVLVPRPETEVLVEHVLLRLSSAPRPILAADLGTGSGIIAVTLAAECDCRVIAVDVSEGALALTRENAATHGVSDRVVTASGDYFQALADAGITDGFMAIAANPPYIPTASIQELMPEVREHEPLSALDGGPEGLDHLLRIIREAFDHLLPYGVLALEFDSGQQDRLRAACTERGYRNIVTVKDYAGRPRVLLADHAP